MTDSINANVIVSMPSQLFTMARSFKAVANGKIYIGKIDTDPVNPENQIQVYVENEDGSHVPVSQPIIINAAGYPVYNGQISKFVTVQGYSMAVYDAYGSQEYYFSRVKNDTRSVTSFLSSRELWKKYLKEFGIVLVDGSFEEGATVSAPNQAVWYKFDGKCYARVTGDSVIVASGSSPDLGWTSDIGSRIKAWLPNTSPNTDVSTRLQALLTAGKGEIKIPDGRYAVNTALVTNFSDSSFPSLGAGSPRYDFVGSSLNNTIFTVDNNFLLTHTGGVSGSVVQGTNTHMRHGDFQIIGTGKTASGGLKYSFCTFIAVENVRAALLGIPVYFSSCIYNYVKNIRVDNSLYGLYIESPDSSFPTNSTYITNSSISSCSRKAIEGVIGLTCNIDNCNFERNGVTGDSSTGAIALRVTQALCVINMNGNYFEANRGDADVHIINAGGGTVVVNLNGVTFNRGGSDGGYTTTNFKISVPGGIGRVILNLNGCHFFTNTSWGYTPTADKPFITPNPNLTVNGLNTCTFSERTSLGTLYSSGEVIPVKVAADGTKISGPDYISVSKSSTGVYGITSSYPLGVSASGNDFVVVAVSNTDGFTVTSTANLSDSAFNVRTKNSSGSPADAAFSVNITRRVG
ncbi:phage head-binding domain-containing protein [Escherichia coli]|uniref:phage head-binding domain-containing protein n=1 Tax=Escherichia coli TaxID=562 RepID=UPI0007E90280|nr:phage head-binding domain-containing protein [Escherichia coli]